jgi:hypothetical protein
MPAPEVTLSVLNGRLVAAGRTFDNKATLKAAGFRFDARRRVWWIEPDQEIAVKARYPGTFGPPAELEDISTRPLIAKVHDGKRTLFVVEQDATRYRVTNLAGQGTEWRGREYFQVVKTYDRPITLAEIRELIDRK